MKAHFLSFKMMLVAMAMASFSVLTLGQPMPPHVLNPENVTTEDSITCRAPVNLTCLEATPTSLTITWDVQGNESMWVVIMNDWQNIITDMPLVRTDLYPAEQYSVTVLANCGMDGLSEWSDTLFVYTACGPVPITEDHTYQQDFESVSDSIIPQCWTRDLPSSLGEETYPYKRDGWLQFAAAPSQTCIISTPDFATPLNELQVFFNAFTTDEVELPFTVGVMNGTEFEPIEEVRLTSVSDGYSVDFHGYTGSGNRIAFKLASSDANTHLAYMENVIVELFEETEFQCPKPRAASVQDVGINWVTLTWTPGGDETKWEVTVDNLIDTIVDNPTVTLRGLEMATYFQRVFVRAVCGEDNFSVWVPIEDFETVCGFPVSASHPYVENFATYHTTGSAHPLCWTFLYYILQGGTPQPYYAHNLVSIQDGDTSLVVDASGSITFTCLPVFEVPYNTLSISFKAKMLGDEGNEMQFGYMTDGYDSVTFVPLTTRTIGLSTTDIFIDFSEYTFPENVRLGFRWCYTPLVVDNVMVSSTDATAICPYVLGMVKIYPNPATDCVHISLEEDGPFFVEVFDIFGRRCLSQLLSGSEADVNLSAVSPGIYIFRIQGSGGIIATQKIIKK